MEIIKKIFKILSVIPAFTSLFKKASITGRVDPIEALDALSSISPSTKKVADTAMHTVNQGGSIQDVANAVSQVGEIEVFGQKVNTKTMIQDLNNAGGVCAGIASILENMKDKSPDEIVNFGKAATDVSNWEDLLKT